MARTCTVTLVAAFLLLAVAGAQAASTDPLILTDYLNDPAGGRKAAEVTGINWSYPSYSGYFTVDDKIGSNMFFWFFPAQNGDKKAPIIMWPFSVSPSLDLVPRNSTWNQQFNIFYVDNPVGTGWSFTQSNKGFTTNEQEVATNLYSMLTQFFTIFSDYQPNDFYVCAESYGGKYGPAISYEIHQQNQDPNVSVFINLKGLSIGDGMMDPQTQTQGYADMWYNLGLVDFLEYKQAKGYETAVEDFIMQERYLPAFEVFDAFLNGDFFPYPTFYNNATGLYDYFNFDTPYYPPNPYDQFMDKYRDNIHVGGGTFWDYNMTVDQYMQDDWMRSVRDILSVVMNNYKVLIYNGQYDIILPPPMAEAFLRTLSWNGELQYLKAEKTIWNLNGEVAGYVRKVNQFTQAVVRQAGHLLPADQPERGLDLITRFILDKPFN